MPKIKYRVVIDKEFLPILLEDTLMYSILQEKNYFSCTDVVPADRYLSMKILMFGELECELFIRNDFVLYYTSWLDNTPPPHGFTNAVSKQ